MRRDPRQTPGAVTPRKRGGDGRAAPRASRGRRGRRPTAAHRLERRAREAADHDHVERLVARRARAWAASRVRRRDADRPLGLRRAGRTGCGSRRGGRGRTTPPWPAARPRRRRPRCARSRTPAAARGRRPRRRARRCSRAPAANSGVIQLKKAPSKPLPGERAHLRPHRGEHQADAGDRLAQRGERLAHRRQRALGEAGADAEPQAVAVEAEALDALVDLRGRRGGRAPSPRPRGRATVAPSAKAASVSSPLAPGWSLDHIEE